MRRILPAILIAILILCCLSSGADAWVRSSSSVPPDDNAYRLLDKLIAFSLCEPPIRSQRPYPRGEFARMTAEAMKKYAEMKEKAGEPKSFKKYVKREARMREIGEVIDALKAEFRGELIDMGAIEGERMRYRIHPIEEFVFYRQYLNSPPTQIPVNNGRGTINALVNPLGDYDLGRHPIDGYQSAEELVARFQLGKFFSAYFRPRLEVNFPRQGDLWGNPYIQNAYGTFKAGNFSMKAGRDSMIWGFGDRGSLLYSTNPRPLDGVWLTNPEPARLPWYFKYLGRWRYTLYAANLGPGYVRKWGWIAGYNLSLAPARYVEIAFGHAVQIGGEGAPTPSAVDVIGEFFGFRPAGTDPNSPNLTNHMFEIGLLVRIPQLRGVELYGNFALEDKWKSVKKTLTHGMSYLGGLYLPALNNTGSMDLRIEYVHSNPLQYRHSRYADGWTINQRLIGSDAGPDANTLYAQFRHSISPKIWYGVTFGWDYRSSDRWVELPNRGDIVKTLSGPTEQRWRGLLDLDWRVKPEIKLHFTGGYERVGNLHFQQNVHRNNFVLAASLHFYWDKYFAFAAN
jgi:hypothetical protein